MEKINRRDYLLQMGVGVAGVIGATSLPLAGQTKKKSQRKTTAPSAKALAAAGLRWVVTDVPPSPDAFVTAVYCGLIEFAYSDGFMDVLFHPGMDHHNLEIQLYKNPPNPPVNCTPYRVIRPQRNDVFTLEVPAQTGKTPDVFQMPGAFDRSRTGNNYDRDFRWLPDLHSLDFYPEGYTLKAVPGTRLEVRNGTFYTRLRSTSTFDIVDADADNAHCREGRYFGHVALCVATAINAQSDVVLRWEGDSETFAWRAGDKYQVVFRNECDNCSSVPRDCNEMTRNDFHFNRKILKIPAQGRVKYGLMLHDGCAGDECAKPDFCIQAPHRLTDEAPCMGASFGKAAGFP